MRLTLKNFRFHRDRTFDIPDEGLVLLEGESGCGKSTILNAIFYALYGNVRKPYSFGASTCSVTLEYKDLTIERTSRPNKLAVRREAKQSTPIYVDDAAQAEIDKRFGSLNSFELASFIRQGIDSSILSVKPSERLAFIETLAFDNDDHIKIKSNIKELVKRCTAEHIKSEGKLEYIKSQLEELGDDEADDEANDEADIKTLIKKLNDKEIALNEKIKALRSKEKEKNGEVFKIQEISRKSSSLSSSIERDIAAYKKLYTKAMKFEQFREFFVLDGEQSVNLPTDEELDELQQEIIIAEKIAAVHVAQLNLKEKEDEREEMMNTFTSSLSARIQMLKTNMMTKEEDKRYEKLLHKQEKIKKIMKYLEKRDKIVKMCEDAKVGLRGEQLAKLRDLHKALRKMLDVSIVYRCPSCKSHLKMMKKEGTLVKTTEPVNESSLSSSTKAHIKEICERIENEKLMNFFSSSHPERETYEYRKKVEKILRVSSTALDELTSKKEASDQNMALYQDLKDQLKNQEPPSFVTPLDDKIESLKKLYEEAVVSLDRLTKNFGRLSSAFERSSSAISAVKQSSSAIPEVNGIEHCSNLKQVYSFITELISLSNKITAGEIELLSMSEGGSSSRPQPLVEELMSEIDEISNEITRNEEKLKDVRSEIVKLNKRYAKFKLAKDAKVKKDKFKDELEQSLASTEQLKLKMLAALDLEQMSQVAEFTSLRRTIESINTTANLYLEDMFDTDLMTVKLEIDTESKRKSLKVSIEYRGDEYADIDELSGGERQKCNLAFIMAINDFVGSKMVMLDECLNNLDDASNSEILMYLKEAASSDTSRLYLVVSHEAVRGIFDDIVDV